LIAAPWIVPPFMSVRDTREQTSDITPVVLMLNARLRAKHTHQTGRNIFWQAADGAAGKKRTTRASPSKDEDDEVSQLTSAARLESK